MLRLQYRVQVMLTHYMLGLLSLLKYSEGKRGESTEKLEAEHKSRGGMKKKSLREKEYDNNICQISVICCREFRETFLWDWQFGVAVAPGASHGKTLTACTHTLPSRPDLLNAIWPRSCALSVSLARSFPPRVTKLCVQRWFGYFPDRRCKWKDIFGKINRVLSDNIKTSGNRLHKWLMTFFFLFFFSQLFWSADIISIVNVSSVRRYTTRKMIVEKKEKYTGPSK